MSDIHIRIPGIVICKVPGKGNADWNLLKIDAASQGLAVSGNSSRSVLTSILGRAFYSYKNRYLLTATIRRDGSSKFGANHKWGWFPSVSAAWGISQEAFMQDISWLNDLKLRAGYGVTGNQDGLKPYKSLELYQPYGTYYNGGGTSTSFRITQNPNPD